MDPHALAARVKTLARAAGFDLVGIASAEAPPELSFFPEWIRRGHAGEMAYLTDQVDRRRDLRQAFSWARSVVAVGLQYDTPHPYSTDVPGSQGRGWLSRYAWGDDYHDVLGTKLEGLAGALQAEAGPLRLRAYVDTGPIVERAYAAAAGLGAWGKNTCLLHPEHGSWFFLGELVTDLELPPDAPRADMCGSCTACLDACPTGALTAPYVLDARLCISYLTIEVKGAIPEERREGLGRHVFGCDICQDVCPWNSKRRHQASASFDPRPGLVAPRLVELTQLDDEGFRSRFRKSPVKRTKRRGLLRNVAVALGNSGADGDGAADEGGSGDEVLDRLARDPDPIVRDHAAWALQRRQRKART